MDTKFYVELPGDEFGNTSRALAVVEATSEADDRGAEILVPVAPAYHVTHCSTGWLRDVYGGWKETEGPARMLSHDEWRELVNR